MINMKSIANAMESTIFRMKFRKKLLEQKKAITLTAKDIQELQQLRKEIDEQKFVLLKEYKRDLFDDHSEKSIVSQINNISSLIHALSNDKNQCFLTNRGNIISCNGFFCEKDVILFDKPDKTIIFPIPSLSFSNERRVYSSYDNLKIIRNMMVKLKMNRVFFKIEKDSEEQIMKQKQIKN